MNNVHGKNIMSDGCVYESWRKFKNKRVRDNDGQQRGICSDIEDVVEKANEIVHEMHSFTISWISSDIFKISKSVVYNVSVFFPELNAGVVDRSLQLTRS